MVQEATSAQVGFTKEAEKARAGEPGLEGLAAEYAQELMAALKRRATRGRHVNVLEHLFAFVSRHQS